MQKSVLVACFLIALTGCTWVKGRMEDCPYTPNCVSSKMQNPIHGIDPIPFRGNPESAMSRMEKVILSMPRTEIVEKEPGYIRAIYISLVFRFRDDVECMVDPEKSVIHIRSSSRLGISDLGANSRRVKEIKRLFDGGLEDDKKQSEDSK